MEVRRAPKHLPGMALSLDSPQTLPSLLYVSHKLVILPSSHPNLHHNGNPFNTLKYSSQQPHL